MQILGPHPRSTEPHILKQRGGWANLGGFVQAHQVNLKYALLRTTGPRSFVLGPPPSILRALCSNHLGNYVEGLKCSPGLCISHKFACHVAIASVYCGVYIASWYCGVYTLSSKTRRHFQTQLEHTWLICTGKNTWIGSYKRNHGQSVSYCLPNQSFSSRPRDSLEDG